MVGQNKRFSFKIKRQAKNVFPRDAERTVVLFRGSEQPVAKKQKIGQI